MNDKRQLLCTFSSVISFKTTIEEIKKFYTVYNNRFFVFSNVNVPKEVFVTYNILSEGKEFPKFPNTISIHRKKQTHTLYTLNAMNQIIKDENGGVFDRDFSVDWSLYTNSLIIVDTSLADTTSIKIIPIKLLEIVN
jgi:hypothetical protein